MTATTIKCRRCHRPLHTPTSRALGLGPTCAKLAQLDNTHTPTQIADAQEAVELGGVIRLRGTGNRRIYQVIGHRGDLYLTAIGGNCNCRAGLVGKPCFHAAAVALYAGATPAVRTPIALPAPLYIRAA